MLRNFLLSIGLSMVVLLYAANFAFGIEASTGQGADKALAQLETRFFEHPYESDTEEDRINRIEQFIFGCTQSGSVNTRLQHILTTVPDDLTNKIINTPSVTSNNSVATKSTGTEDTEDTSDDQGGAESAAGTTNDTSSYSSYPRVSSLEQEILGHTYQTDTLPHRLARLETKAFGNVSVSTDLGERVDNLDDYAQRHDLYGDRKIANSTNSSLAFVPPKNMRQPANQSVYPVYPSDNQDSISPQRVYTSKSGSFVGSIEERVAMMEAQEFDHTYPEKPLEKRLNKLEKKILPGQDNSQLGLFQRTSKLWITLHPASKTNMDNLIADNDTGSSFSSNSDVASTGQTSANNSKHSSWLHKLANKIEAVATAPYSGYSNFSGASGTPSYPYPGSFYVPQTSNYANSRFIGGSFGPGVGPGGLPLGFW